MIQEDKYLNQCLQFCAVYNLLVCSQQLALIPTENNIKKYDKPNKSKTNKKFQTITKKKDPQSKKKSKFQTVSTNKSKANKNSTTKVQKQQNYNQSQHQSEHKSSKRNLNQSEQFYESQKFQQPKQFSLNSLLSQLATTSTLKKNSKDPISNNLWNNQKFQQQQNYKHNSYKQQPQTNKYIYSNNNNRAERNSYQNYNNNAYNNQYYKREENPNFNYNSNYNYKYNYNQNPIQQNPMTPVPQSKYGNQFRIPQSMNYINYNLPSQSQKNIFQVVNQNQPQYVNNPYNQYGKNPSVMNLNANEIQKNMFNRQDQQPLKNSIMYSPVRRSQSPLNNSFSCRQFNQSPREVSINRKGLQKSKSKKKMKKGQRQFYQPKSARRIAIQQQNNQKQGQNNDQLEEQREMSINVNLKTPELQGKCRQQRITDQTQITEFRNYNNGRVESKTSRMQDKKSKPTPKKLIQLDDGLSQSISVLTQSRKVQKPIKINIQNKH